MINKKKYTALFVQKESMMMEWRKKFGNQHYMNNMNIKFILILFLKVSISKAEKQEFGQNLSGIHQKLVCWPSLEEIIKITRNMDIGHLKKNKMIYILMKFIIMVEFMSKVLKLKIGKKSEFIKTFMLIPLCK